MVGDGLAMLGEPNFSSSLSPSRLFSNHPSSADTPGVSAGLPLHGGPRVAHREVGSSRDDPLNHVFI